jgi:hypothetical protein
MSRMKNAIFALTAAWALGGSAAALADPIATTDGEAPGLHLAVQELKVSGGALMLKFTVTNDSDKTSAVLSLINSGKEGWAADGVYLLDVPGKKKYLVVRDADGYCLCSRGLDNLAAKANSTLWAKFPAPPDSVQKIGIVVPHFVPLDDVPISR